MHTPDIRLIIANSGARSGNASRGRTKGSNDRLLAEQAVSPEARLLRGFARPVVSACVVGLDRSVGFLRALAWVSAVRPGLDLTSCVLSLRAPAWD